MRVLAAGSVGLAAGGVSLAAGQALGAEHWGASFATAAAAEQTAAAAALAVTAAAIGAMAVYAQARDGFGRDGFGAFGFGSAPAQQPQSLTAAIKAAARAAGVKARTVKTASRGGPQRDLQEMRRRLSLVRDRQAACRAARQSSPTQTGALGEALSLEAFLTQTAPNAVRRTQAQIAAQLASRPRPAAAPALSEDEQRRIDPMFNALRGIGRFHREHRVRRHTG